MEVHLIPLRDLAPHEETIEHNTATVLASIAEARTVYSPLLVDADTLTIIDGHHRYASLAKLKARYAPAILVRPDEHQIRVEARPLYSTLEPQRLAGKIQERLKKGPARLTIEGPDTRIVLHVDPIEAYTILPTIDSVYTRSPRTVATVIVREPLQHNIVSRLARNNVLLKPKSTNYNTKLKNRHYPTRLARLY